MSNPEPCLLTFEYMVQRHQRSHYFWFYQSQGSKNYLKEDVWASPISQKFNISSTSKFNLQKIHHIINHKMDTHILDAASKNIFFLTTGLLNFFCSHGFTLSCVGVPGHEAVHKSQQSLITSTSAWRTFTRTLPDASNIQDKCMRFTF